MRSSFRPLLALFALASLGGCVVEANTPPQPAPSQPAAGAPAVGSPTDLSSFEGARAGQAENGIYNLGYEPIRTEGLTTWWFNRETGACARIMTSNGRYSDVTMLPAEDC
jgi:hypothetical protein